MRRALPLFRLLLLLPCGFVFAAPDIDCVVQHYNRYIDQHNDAFLNAAVELEQGSPDDYELLSDFIDYQIRSNTLKAYVAGYLGAKAPRQLLLNEALAKVVPPHDQGAPHVILMSDITYRDSYPEWKSQSRRFLQKSSYSAQEWSEFVAARNALNRQLATTPQFPAVIAAYQTPVGELCRIR